MADEKDDFEKLGFDASTFAALEADFENTLVELSEPHLERFKAEYETLHRALKKSHESEKRLMKKCKELSVEIGSTNNKAGTALKLSQEDQGVIQQLKKDIEKTWSAVEQSHEKETQTKETLSALRREIDNLRNSVERGAGSSIAQENKLRDLGATRDELARDRDSHAQQVQAVRSEIGELTERVRLLENERVLADNAVSELTNAVNLKRQETDRERKRKERLEKELKEMKVVVEKRHDEIKGRQARVTAGLDEGSKLEAQLREQKQHTDRTLKEVDGLTQKVTKLQAELEEQVHSNVSLINENVQRHSELRTKQAEIATIQAEAGRMEKLRDALLRKVATLDDQKREADDKRDSLKGEVSEKEAEIEAQRRERETERKMIDDLVRERDILNKNLVKASSATQQQVDLLKINENTKRNLEVEIAAYRSAAQSQSRTIKRLQGEKARYAAESSEAQSRFAQAIDEVKARQIKVLQLQKKIAEGEAKLKQQQNLYEAVRSDRNLYSKNLIESQDEIAEMKRKFKIMTRQIDHLKDDIQQKDQLLVKEHFEHMKVEREKESLREGLATVQKHLSKSEGEEVRFKSEVSKLNQIINEAEAERMKQQKEYDIVVSERDILGTQLIKRNDELSHLYEKIKIQQCTLNRGEQAYGERVTDLGVVKREGTALRGELQVLKASVANMDLLKHETFTLQRDLLQERTKVRALSEELDNQMNVHRWRKLEGSDPNMYNMITRTHTLQKQLIRRTEEVAEKDKLIQSKEKLYVELKAILARQPGPEVAEQLSIYQDNLSEKQKQLKAMTAELNVHRQQVSDLKLDQESLHTQLSQTKKRYFSIRQKQRRQLQLGVDFDEHGPPPPLPPLGGDASALLQTGAFGAGDAGGPPPADAPPDAPF
jgi:chromosome segregation ATPase